MYVHHNEYISQFINPTIKRIYKNCSCKHVYIVSRDARPTHAEKTPGHLKSKLVDRYVRIR